MANWQNCPTDLDGRLIDLSNLFLGCREAFHDTTNRFRWAPDPGSPAAAAAAELCSSDDGMADPAGETEHRLITEVVRTYFLSASGHLGGLASLYAAGEVAFSAPVLIRATIESCARAVWVLGDSNEPTENRLARAYLEELLSAEEAKKNAGRMRSKTAPSHLQAKKAYDSIKYKMLMQFPQAAMGADGKWDLNGVVLIRPEDAVVWMYKLTETFGGTIGTRAASGIYGFLSNMTHPTLYAARQSGHGLEGSVSGHRLDCQRIGMGSAEDEARAALAAFYNALNYTTSYFGWPTAVVDDLAVQIEDSIPAFFR